MSELSLSDRVPQNNITLVELNLFQRCLERILEQAQFRAYLSKLVVLGSTGHTSWCFYYTQNFEGGHYTKRLKTKLLMPMSTTCGTEWLNVYKHSVVPFILVTMLQ